MFLALVKDLMFASRISAEARAANVECKIVRDPNRLKEMDAVGIRALLVDLNMPEAIPAAAQWGSSNKVPVLGFVSHVDVDTITQARAAGIRHVLARGRFVQLLPRILRGEEAGFESKDSISEDSQ